MYVQGGGGWSHGEWWVVGWLGERVNGWVGNGFWVVLTPAHTLAQ